MKIYTKTGDLGTTALFGGDRVAKHHIRIESYGTVDELNSWIGLLRDQQIDKETKDLLIAVQHKLFTIGAIMATPPEKEKLKSGKDRLNIERIEDKDIAILEEAIDKMDAELPAMTHFILPGGHPAVSYCHLARTVCRRAERRATHLYENEPFEKIVIRYLNRLSDYLFVLARKLTKDLQAEEVPWIPEKKS
ncbi:cob(I)yrinic acid a,c-diamide adenosyltransferase [Robertkochia sediminum]|uniref:cob(I)yrinic acid a,c-diamide adenosyltransferase n=1 Tax=Robertkochia sediminum TaxID=2785326 RepID=UPI0019330D93|nr:cob(I)yrinic acid a,c-diamide adenosyltransferase [Robertkochia sediminum]MBL7472621.1 cob(I)yrinic acid a,c-diamide adenosyltransferase [Robertkochia sediminum]